MLKNEWKWILGALALSLFIHGLLTGFSFSAVEFRSRDTYLVLEARHFVFYFAAFLLIVPGFYRLVDSGTRTNRILALVVSFTFPIAILFLIMWLGMYARVFSIPSASGRLSAWLPVVCLLFVLVLLVVLEVKAVRRAWALVRK